MRNIIAMLVVMISMIVSNQSFAGTYNQSVCAGNSVIIGNAWPSGTVYIWNTVPAQYTTQITVTPATNTQYIVNVLGIGYVPMGADTFNITVNQPPTGTITPNQTICAGGTATLTATGGTNYLWLPGGISGPSLTVLNLTSTTTYAVVITGSNGCSVNLGSTVTVNPLPIVSIGPNQSICTGSPLNLTATANAGASYSWSGPNGFTSNQQNPTIANSIAANAGNYSVTVSLNGCTATANTNVMVNPLPVITALTNNSPICSGSNLSLNATANPGASYSWSGPNGFNSNLQNPTITNVTTANAGNYIVTATLNGCIATANTSVIVNPIPVFTAVGSNSPICSGANLNLNATANPGSAYSWTGPNSFSSNLQNPVIANVTTANAGNYSVTVTLNGCSTSTNTGVIVNQNPTVTASSSSTVCAGTSIFLFANGTAGSSYIWSGPNNFTSSLQNPVITNASNVNAGNYAVTATLNNCTAGSTTTVVVDPLPNASISGNTSICTGGSTTLTANGGNSYLWSNGATTVSITVSPTTTTTYSVVVTGNNSCMATAFATVIVNLTPTINFSPTNTTICEGQNITLTASGGNTYLWSNGASGPSITVSPNNTATYTVTATSSTSCTATGNITVTVDPKPIVVLYLPQQNVCLDANPITLTGGFPVGGTYYGSGIFGGLFYPSTVGVGTYNIGYDYTNIYGCSATATALLTVNPLPTVIFNSIFPNPVSINAQAFQLNTGVPLGGIYSGPGVVGGWFYPTTAGIGIHTITYTYTDFMNCVNTAMQTISVVTNTGIEDENSSSLIRIYPNPVTEYLNIEMEDKPDYVQIIGMTGNVLFTNKVDSPKFGLDVSSLSKGIYFIRLGFEDGSVGTTKFVK